jgi:hypothetical protein
MQQRIIRSQRFFSYASVFGCSMWCSLELRQLCIQEGKNIGVFGYLDPERSLDAMSLIGVSTNPDWPPTRVGSAQARSELACLPGSDTTIVETYIQRHRQECTFLLSKMPRAYSPHQLLKI